MARRILIIGPSIERTKGGMATVILNTLNLNAGRDDYQFHHLVSHVEGSVAERLVITVKAMFSILFGRSFDLAHIHVASSGSFFRKSLFVILCKILRKPVVLHVHGADFDKFYLHSASPIRRYIRWTFSATNAVFVLSNYWADFFRKHIVSNNVIVVHNGVDVSAFESCINTNTPYNRFLFLGRLGKRKGIYDLLEVITTIVKTTPSTNMHFYLAGDGEIEQVKSIIEQRNLSKNVTLVGWIDIEKKLHYLKNTDCLLLPSYDEGLPMSILEAMACGKIIISTYVGGIPDLVRHNENGFMIQPGDLGGLEVSVKSVEADPTLMKQMSRNNIDRITDLYNLRKINEEIIEIYSRLIVRK